MHACSKYIYRPAHLRSLYTDEVGIHLQNPFQTFCTVHESDWRPCVVLCEYNIRQTELMMSSSNGNIFCVTGPLWGKSNGHRWIPPQMSATPSFDVFLDLRLNKRLSKQSRCRWFETPPCSLWRHCNVTAQRHCSHNITNKMIMIASGTRFNIKMTSYQYGKSQCGDKTILRPSYLYNGISYIGKTTPLYWIRALTTCTYWDTIATKLWNSVQQGLAQYIWQ